MLKGEGEGMVDRDKDRDGLVSDETRVQEATMFELEVKALHYMRAPGI